MQQLLTEKYMQLKIESNQPYSYYAYAYVYICICVAPLSKQETEL